MEILELRSAEQQHWRPQIIPTQRLERLTELTYRRQLQYCLLLVVAVGCRTKRNYSEILSNIDFGRHVRSRTKLGQLSVLSP